MRLDPSLFFSQALPLVSWSRRLELQGELTELGCRRGGVLFNSRPRFTPLCLLLFSDLLLITQPKRWVLRGRGGSLSRTREEASSRTPALL